MDIKQDTRNDLLHRKEIQVVAPSEKTLSYPEAAKLISEHFKAPEENIMIEGVRGKFGRKNFLIKASIYDTKELKEEAVKRLTKQKKEKAAEGSAPAEGGKK